jgi:hypothetical protein
VRSTPLERGTSSRRVAPTVAADTEVTWVLEVVSGGSKKSNTLSSRASTFEMDGETPVLTKE